MHTHSWGHPARDVVRHTNRQPLSPVAAAWRSGRPMGVGDGRSSPGPHLRLALSPRGRRTHHLECQACKEAGAEWQGGLRRVRPDVDVLRRGGVMRAHA